MFPFSLNGPQFLLFYAALAGLVLLAWQVIRRAGTAAPPGGEAALAALTADPYAIACLRAGPAEAVRLATFNLMDRGLLVAAKGATLRSSNQGESGLQRRPLDAVILRKCHAAPMTPRDIAEDRSVKTIAASLERDLQDRGLLLAPAQQSERRRLRLGLLLLLAGVAAVRLAQALAAGRSNVGGLVVLAILGGVALCVMPVPQVTGPGRQALALLQGLMARLRGRADQLRPGGATNEAMLLAATFGLLALPAATFGMVDQIQKRPDSSAGGDGGSGSSDSSSCSSSGGGSCGGGGGCGGCGGGG